MLAAGAGLFVGGAQLYRLQLFSEAVPIPARPAAPLFLPIQGELLVCGLLHCVDGNFFGLFGTSHHGRGMLFEVPDVDLQDYDQTPIGFGVVIFLLANQDMEQQLYERFYKVCSCAQKAAVSCMCSAELLPPETVLALWTLHTATHSCSLAGFQPLWRGQHPH